MACAICGIRKPKRYCPGVRGNICAICCGTEREQTVDCPFECVYLQEAHIRERLPDLSNDDFPNKDIRVGEDFLRKHEELLAFLGVTILHAALNYPGTVDADIREALEALIANYKTLQSGIIYDNIPTNPLAANIYDTVQKEVPRYREMLRERTGMETLRDSDILTLLVFFQRLAIQHDNTRRKGRLFIDFLRHQFPEDKFPLSSASQLVL